MQIKRTLSHIEEQNPNVQSHEQISDKANNKSINFSINNSMQNNKNKQPQFQNDHIIEMQQISLSKKFSKNHTEEMWSDIEKRQKMPDSLKKTLRQRAKDSGRYKQKKQETKKSRIGQMISSHIRKQEVVCAICLGVLRQKQIVHLCPCDHIYCRSCITSYVNFKIGMFEQVVCPDENCDIVMNQETDFYKKLPQETRKKYIKIHQFYMTSQDPTLKLCPRQHCDGIIKIIQGQARICNLCGKQFCPKCYFEKHQGQCDKNEIQFLQNNLKYRQCGNCGMVVQRTEGCNHMTCRCKYEFCYICGKKWTGYGHLCNENNGGVGDANDQTCCECGCCEETFGRTCMLITTFPLKLIASLFVLLLVVLMAANSIILIILYAILSLFAGIFGFSIDFICTLCEEDHQLLGLLMVILFPVAILVGIYSAFKEMFVELAAEQLEELRDTLVDGCQSIW